MGRALDDAFAEARGRVRRGRRALGYPLSKLCFEGPGGGADADRERAAGDPGHQHRRAARARARGRRFGRWRWRATRSANTARWSRRARCGSRTPSRLVHLRGKFMQDAVPAGVGAMAAIIGLSARRRAPPCREEASADRGRQPGEPQRRRPGGDRRATRPRSSGPWRCRQAARRQAGDAAGGERPVPLRADAAGGRAPGRRARARRGEGARGAGGEPTSRRSRTRTRRA